MLARATLGKTTDAIPEPDPTYVFHNPFHYALTTWRMWNDHGITPDGLPYLDQPQGLVEDWRYITHYHNWACDRMLRQDNSGTDDMGGLIASFDTDDAPRLSISTLKGRIS